MRVLSAAAFASLLVLSAEPAKAQQAIPVGARAQSRADVPAGSTVRQRPSLERPRPLVVGSLALLLGVAGGIAGYYAAEESCARTRAECWDHFAYIPIGYVAGVALGGGMAGSAEGCRSAPLRSLGGAVLGFIGGALVGGAAESVGILALPAGPLIGATWWVASCRTARRGPADSATPASGQP